LRSGRHGAPLTAGGRPGILHGSRSAVMQDAEGQIMQAHSISAGLDYPGAGPQHAFLRDTGRARYVAMSDREALAAFRELSRLEGIIPALETAHAIAWVLAQQDGTPDPVCLAGRGDKDPADGPVIHAAATAALEGGATLPAVLDVARALAPRAPVVLMCYANMVFAPGLDAFVERLADTGACGVIVPDLPLEESAELREACD